MEQMKNYIIDAVAKRLSNTGLSMHTVKLAVDMMTASQIEETYTAIKRGVLNEI